MNTVRHHLLTSVHLKVSGVHGKHVCRTPTTMSYLSVVAPHNHHVRCLNTHATPHTHSWKKTLTVCLGYIGIFPISFLFPSWTYSVWQTELRMYNKLCTAPSTAPLFHYHPLPLSYDALPCRHLCS